MVTAFNRYRKKTWSLVDVKLERVHLERTRKALGNSIRANPREEVVYNKIGMVGERFETNT